MNKNSLIPKLRFPEFKNEEEWEEKKLGEVAEFLKGKNISKADICDNGQIACIRYGELYTIYDEVINEIVSFTDLPQETLVFSKANDVIIPASGETQIDIAKASCVSLSNIALGGDLNIIRSSANGIFLSYYLNHPLKYSIARLAQGNAVVHLYNGQLKSLSLHIPKNPLEQQKIADCLSSLDEVIEGYEERLLALQDHKRGLMQNLFPQEGKTKPKYRFPEFKNDGEWESKKLGEVAKFRRGSFPQPYGLAEWYDEKGEPFVQVFDVDENLRLKPQTQRRISKLASEQSVYIPKETVIITIQGSIGRVAITQYDAYVDRTLLLFEEFYYPLVKVFFAYVLQLLFEIEKQKAPGAVIKTITKKVLSDFVIKLPSINEQQKIADCLSSIDDLITGQTERIEQLRQHKRGLMQGLFPKIEE